MQDGETRTEIRGSVENVTFRNGDSGFTVVDINSGGELVTAVGVLPQLTEGEEIRLSGHWDFHASFGRQFRVEICERTMPKTTEDLLNYLSSGIIKGIGPSTASKIVGEFGEETFDVLENEPARLAKIKGITRAKAEEISARFKEQFAVREIMIALERYGMTSAECLHAYKVFKSNAVDTIRDNPYILCSEKIGMSFERADEIASSMSDSFNETFRMLAGVLHVFRYNISNGHTCLPRNKLFAPCSDLLGIDSHRVSEIIDMLIEQSRLISEQIDGREFLFLPHMYMAEKDTAEHIKMILRFPPSGRGALMEEIGIAEIKENVTYEKKQREAIQTAVEKGLLILTGGPGTGKTTALKGIIRLFEDRGLNIALAAPTGRAAKRMSDVTGREAKTIHRLLEVEWDESDRPIFQRNERNPIDANALILDELSMVDIYVFSSLLKALPIGCRLIMVGDADQLPPVGAGNVLQDMIGSGLLPVVQLTEVFRQAMQSMIVTNAHKIVRGEMPELGCRDKDFFFMERGSFATAQTVAELCAVRLPKAYGYSPLDDIQVLCPSRKGETGSNNINRIMQSMLNPPIDGKREINIKGRIFREGDKVMQIKNNYHIIWTKGEEEGEGIFNGDIGVLKEIRTAESMLLIEFDKRVAEYPIEAAQELELAYAVTVHKSQGNEFEAVIMPAVGIVPQLSYRNLLYTAVTRARAMMIIVGSAEQVRSMTENNKKARRYSALKHFLLDCND